MSEPEIFQAEKRARRQSHRRVWAIVIGMSVLIGGTAAATISIWSQRRAAEDAARELREQAEGMVRDKLMAPSTAKFPATNLIERGPGRYFYHVAVDAQNSFGVYLREHYCVIFFVKPDGTVRWHKKYGVQTCKSTPEESPLDTMKGLNSWDTNLERPMP